MKIRGEQTITTAPDLRRTLTAELMSGQTMALDLSEVQVCDTAALQLLYAVRRTALQRNLPFQITAVSQAVIETAAALGLRIEDLTFAGGPATGDSRREVEGTDGGL